MTLGIWLRKMRARQNCGRPLRNEYLKATWAGPESWFTYVPWAKLLWPVETMASESYPRKQNPPKGRGQGEDSWQSTTADVKWGPAHPRQASRRWEYGQEAVIPQASHCPGRMRWALLEGNTPASCCFTIRSFMGIRGSCLHLIATESY